MRARIAAGVVDHGDALAGEGAGDRVRLQQEHDLVILQHQHGVLNPAGRIVNVGQQRAFAAQVLKPVMRRAVDLDQFANALAAPSRHDDFETRKLLLRH
jgi:hypothetical protein